MLEVLLMLPLEAIVSGVLGFDGVLALLSLGAVLSPGDTDSFRDNKR